MNAPKSTLVVMDAGIAKEENLTWLGTAIQFDPEQAVALANASGDTVRLQKIIDETGGEARLYSL